MANPPPIPQVPPALPIAQLPPPEEPSFWDTVLAKLKAFGKWCSKHLVAPGVALLIVVAAVLLACLGFKKYVQVGGLLAKILGKQPPEHKAIDVANTIPEDRVDAKGRVIPQGEPDSKGMTQAVVVPIKDPGIFANPDTVVFTPPGEEKAVEIKLPDGVKAKDVEKVVVVKPEKFVVTVKDKSGITAKKVDDLLKKYGG